MKQLDVVKHLEGVFGRRHLCRHAGKRGLTLYADGETSIAIVLDLSIGRQILTSSSFRAFNYFADGYRRFGDSNPSFGLIHTHFNGSPLFLEGENHRLTKQAFARLLRVQADILRENENRIKKFMIKRKNRIDSAIDFAHAFVEICLAMIISRLSSRPLRIALGALRARRNVFYFYFHPNRHLGANEALRSLEPRIDEAGATPGVSHELLLCQSFVLMAYDPLVATICASVVDGRTNELPESADLYCPTSFVSRICIEPVTIGAHSFQGGDVSYVALVPALDESVDKTFPFGVGPHICVGKKISIQILDLAKQIIASDFSEGFRNKPVLSPDGAFLSFRN